MEAIEHVMGEVKGLDLDFLLQVFQNAFGQDLDMVGFVWIE